MNYRPEVFCLKIPEGVKWKRDLTGLDKAFREKFGLEPVDLKTYSPLTLAYIGDAAYELVIRSLVVEQGNAPVNKIHKRSSQLVKAKTQAEAALKLQEVFTEEEMSVYKRGRNTVPIPWPKMRKWWITGWLQDLKR